MPDGSRASLVVFAKQPRPGAVKTRLCPPFTPDQAASFYGEMLRDVLAASAGFAAALDLEATLAVWPPEAVGPMSRDVPTRFRVVAQRGAGLSERMSHAFGEQWAAGSRRVLLRGSDSPVLDEDTLREALHRLADHDLVVCPDLDGGYNLVGLRRPAPGVFDHPMSTGEVLEATLAKASGLGLTAHVLEPRFDVDTHDDLALLAAARADGRTGTCPATLSWLDAHGFWPEPT